MKPITIILLTYLALLAACIGCNKSKITRATPKFSMKYDGVYTESNDPSVNFHKVQKLDNTYEYYIAVPCEATYLQMHIDTDSLYAGNHTGTAAMIWTFSSTYFGNINVNFTSVNPTATGTFSGVIWNTVDNDTIVITDGTFLNINYP